MSITCTELRLVEAIEITPQRVPCPGQPRVHGSLQSGPDHVHLRAAAGNEEVGSGRKRIQGTARLRV